MEKELEIMLSLLGDIYSRKMMIFEGKSHFHDVEKIKNDVRYEITKKMIDYYYYDKEFGIKYMIKSLNLPITYTVFRNVLINIFDIKLRKHNDITSHIKMIRKEKAIYESINNIGWASEEIRKTQKIKNTITRGIQGYYYNNSMKKNVWLRSSWEYIYAKWLDSKKIIWDIECNVYNVDDKKYRPDFFIFNENKELIKIVEIKGYWKDKVWKYDILKELLNIELSMITDIKPYTNNWRHDIKEWKEKRIIK